jgi:hypothetical protein
MEWVKPIRLPILLKCTNFFWNDFSKYMISVRCGMKGYSCKISIKSGSYKLEPREYYKWPHFFAARKSYCVRTYIHMQFVLEFWELNRSLFWLFQSKGIIGAWEPKAIAELCFLFFLNNTTVTWRGIWREGNPHSCGLDIFQRDAEICCFEQASAYDVRHVQTQLAE